jgi:5'-nucleotidase
VLEMLERIRCEPVPAETILNVNVPDLPYAALKGWQVTRLGHRHKSEPVIRQTDPRGRPIYWVGPAGSEQDAGPGTDFHAVRHGYVSITPIHVDLTRHDVIDSVKACLGERAQPS